MKMHPEHHEWVAVSIYTIAAAKESSPRYRDMFPTGPCSLCRKHIRDCHPDGPSGSGFAPIAAMGGACTAGDSYDVWIPVDVFATMKLEGAIP